MHTKSEYFQISVHDKCHVFREIQFIPFDNIRTKSPSNNVKKNYFRIRVFLFS